MEPKDSLAQKVQEILNYLSKENITEVLILELETLAIKNKQLQLAQKIKKVQSEKDCTF